MKIMSSLIAVAQRFAASIVASAMGQSIARLWARFATTRAHKILLAPVAWLAAKKAHLKETYDQLLGENVDVIEQKMMLTDVDIDLDDEGDVGRGHTVFILITSFFVIAVLWGAFADLDEAVRAEGEIVPPSSVQTVQSRLPGNVAEIAAKLGDRVQAGDILFRLEDQDMQAVFDNNEIKRINSGAAAARLHAEIDGADDVNFPPDLVANNPTAVEAERALFNQRKAALDDRLRVLDRAIAEKQAEIHMYAAAVENLSEEIKILEPLVAEGHEARLTLLSRKTELAQSQGAYDLAKIAAERSRHERESAISEFRARAAAELAQFRNEVEQADAQQIALQGKVNDAVIRAPVSGIVSAVHVKTLGAVVQAGTLLAEIVPDEKAVLVRARVLAQDIAGIHVGQRANITLNAYDVSIYGAMQGQVQQIASNTTQEQQHPPYYETMIEIPNPQFSKSVEGVEIVPGMGVLVNILGQKRSVLSYIFSPINKAASIAFRER
jgi:HlyD family type I secretion membrane fusion protein